MLLTNKLRKTYFVEKGILYRTRRHKCSIPVSSRLVEINREQLIEREKLIKFLEQEQ